MTDDLTPSDLTLLTMLRRVVEVLDPEPEYLRELGRAAFSVRRVDAELAELVSDSALQRELVRSASEDPRLLTFQVGGLFIELQVSRLETRRELIGLVEGLESAGEGEGRVEIEAARGDVLSAPLDEFGRFGFDEVPMRLVRFRVLTTAVDVTTDWVNLAG
ncbi:MAG: hypothetical protein WCG47_25960 [Dermatophilaceae bacterium]